MLGYLFFDVIFYKYHPLFKSLLKKELNEKLNNVKQRVAFKQQKPET